MKMVSTAFCTTGLSSHVFKNPTKTIQGQIFNQSIHRDWNREWSMEQEENNDTKSSTGKVKDGRERNTTINWIFVSYNVDVLWVNYSPLRQSWKTHGSKKVSCLYQSTWSNRTLYFNIFFIVFPGAVSYFHPVTVKIIFLHCVRRVRIIRS